jgi:hypothetical protein
MYWIQQHSLGGVDVFYSDSDERPPRAEAEEIAQRIGIDRKQLLGP